MCRQEGPHLERPPNDRPSGAIALDVLEEGRALVLEEIGDSAGAWPHGVASCGLGTRGLFYEVQGTGRPLVVTLMVLLLWEESARLGISVFSETEGCVVASGFWGGVANPYAVSFDTQPGETYSIGVTGEAYSGVGRFAIGVAEETRGAVSGAFHLSMAETLVGYLMTAVAAGWLLLL